MSSHTNSQATDSMNNPIGRRVVWAFGGLTAGFILCAAGMVLMMPKMMLTVHQSRFDTVEETCAHLQTAIEDAGWNSPAVRDVRQTMARHGVQFPGDVRIVELCKAEYADRILRSNPEVLTLMPCAWGVYAGPDGRIYISGMNMGLMGKMFGGTIAEVMGGDVAKDEHSMLANVIAE